MWEEEGLEPVLTRRRDGADAAAAGPAVLASTRSGRRSPRAGCPRRRTSSAACCGRGSTSSSRSRTAARRCASRRCCAASRRRCSSRATSRPGSTFAVVARAPRVRLARARLRAAPRHAGLPQAAAARDRRAGPRAAELLRPAHRRLRRARGPRASRSCSASRRRRSPASRATTCCSPTAATTASTSRTSRSARSAATSAPTRKAPTLSKLGGKAWDNLKTRARAHLREMAGELLQLYAQRQTQPGVAYDVEHEWVEQLESEFPYRETDDQRTAIEAVMEDLESPHPMDRLVCGDVGFGKTEVALRGGVRRRGQRQAGADARADDRARAAALEHVPQPLPRLPGARRDGLALPQAVGREAGARRLRRRKGRRPDRHAPRPLARRDPEGARARDRRRGAAVRRRAEGAAAAASPRGRRARAQRDADPAHAAHVARRPARHLGDRDAAGRAAADPHVRRRVRRGADQGGARARDRAQRPGVLPAQPRRDDRGGARRSCSSCARTCASSSRTGRCRSASSRTR